MTTEDERRNFFADYYQNIKEMNPVGDHAVRSSLLFLLANSMPNTRYEDKLGTVKPNLSFLQIDNPGIGKSLLISMMRFVIEKMQTLYNENQNGSLEITQESKFTSQAIRKGLHDYKKEHGTEPVNILMIRDEVSTLFKDNKISAFSDILETLSELWNGELNPYNTIERGKETYPPIFCNMWLAGSRVFYSKVTDDFFQQGFSSRTLCIKSEPIPKHNIIGDNTKKESQEHMSENMYKNYFSKLLRVTEVGATKEFEKKVNEYAEEIQDKLNEAQKNKIPDIKILSKNKYSLIVLKLSIILAGSRIHYDNNVEEIKQENAFDIEDNSHDKSNLRLIMDVQDFEKAKQLLEEYNEAFLEYYDNYLMASEKQFAPSSMTKVTQQFLNTIEKIREKGKTYSIIEDGIIGTTKSYKYQRDKEGDWFVLQDIWNNHNSWDKPTRNRIVNELLTQGTIERLVAYGNNNRNVELVRVKVEE